MSVSEEQMGSYEKKDPKQIEVEINPVEVNVHGVMTITIPFDMYNSLMEIKGRYEEIKDGEDDNEKFVEEYKELLIIKGRYEELVSMNDSCYPMDIDDCDGLPGMVDHKVTLLSRNEPHPKEEACCTVAEDECCREAIEESHIPGPDDNGNGGCRGM